MTGLDEAAETYERLKRERKVTATRLGGLRGDLERAKDQERAALARALKEGKAARRRRRSRRSTRTSWSQRSVSRHLEEAIDLASDDLIVVADDHREEWTETGPRGGRRSADGVRAGSRGSRVSVSCAAREDRTPPLGTPVPRGRDVVSGSRIERPRAARASRRPVLASTRSCRRCERTRRSTYDPRAWVSRDPLGRADPGAARREAGERGEGARLLHG